MDRTPRALLRPLATLLGLCALSSLAAPPRAGQGDAPPRGGDDPEWVNPGAPVGVPRESMWFAPTAEDWARPVLITFQRTWEDAVAVSQETGKPILVCINMDGEIASEHYAGVRYRRPESAALYEPYVCVIASVYRHSPRDHDEEGRRVLCPRFGSVTCGEHISIEPLLFERFMDGQRVAPRHIMVELDGEEVFDVYYAFDTASVFAAIRGGIADRAPGLLRDVVRGDRPIVERVASRDVADREAVEQAYLEGDADLRRALLEAAREHAEAAPVDLLRLGIFGLDSDLAARARAALARTRSEGAVDLIADALRVPLDEAEREALVGALAEMGESSPRARTLAVVHRGLSARSRDVDVEGWSSSLSGGASYALAADRAALEARLEREALAAETRPDDALARVELAEASLALAVDPEASSVLGRDARTQSAYARLFLEDARRAALEAEELGRDSLGAEAWRLHAVLALSAFYLDDLDEAYARAEAAAPGIPTGAPDWSAISTLALFAQARQRAILAAVRAKEDWPGEWLTDVDAAYGVLARHPLGTDEHVAAHHDFLRSMGAGGRASRVLDAGLARFPDSWTLHERLRGRILWEKGVDGLDTVYRELLAREDASPHLPWFAGYAAIVGAEFHRRRGRDAQALAAYERAIELYESWISDHPDSRDTADHYVALALAGRARLSFERGEHDAALEDVLASFTRKPEAAATDDGLGLSPVATANVLLERLRSLERADEAARLESALASLHPELLRLPAYEREGPQRPAEGRAPRRRRGGEPR